MPPGVMLPPDGVPPGAVITVDPCAFAPSRTSEVPAARAPKRWPATSAMSATSAMAATAHGIALPKPADRPTPPVPAGVPHR